jgi:hypothetical protein
MIGLYQALLLSRSRCENAQFGFLIADTQLYFISRIDELPGTMATNLIKPKIPGISLGQVVNQGPGAWEEFPLG